MALRKIYIEQSGLTVAQARSMISAIEAMGKTGVVAFGISHITYDSKAPGYKPNDPKTWTSDKYVGKFNAILVYKDTNPTTSLSNLNAFLFASSGTSVPQVSKELNQTTDAALWSLIKCHEEVNTKPGTGTK